MLLRLAIVLLLGYPALAQACVDLTSYYPTTETNWSELEQQLRAIMPECLESAEYFALLGASQLNSGLLAEAFESLERALLLDPENGSAQVDYSQALYETGQLFSAIEMNRNLLKRDDLPANLVAVLEERRREWQGLTRELDFQADILAGYDNNLNGAPSADLITLTLSGESVLLPLNPDFRSISGPYLNVRVGGRYRQLASTHQQNWTTQIRGRFSEDSNSDLVQLDSRYSLLRPSNTRSWQIETGISNLFFGGEALYMATEGRIRYIPKSDGRCGPYYGLALQHQLFHNQSNLNAVESKLSGGLSCPRVTDRGNQRVSAELALLQNNSVNTGRPGGNRRGWQLATEWQVATELGVFSAQLNHTQLQDKKGYSPVLAAGEERWVERSYALFQFRRPVKLGHKNATFVINLYHQDQRSNIELFETIDTTIEAGFSLSF